MAKGKQCAVPMGRAARRPVAIAAICEVQIGVCLQSGKINLGHVGHGVDAAIAHMGSGQFARGKRLMQPANYLALNPKMLAHLLSQEVKLEVVNRYPALVFPNEQPIFLHTRNYMVAHGVIALPGNTHLDLTLTGNRKNAAPPPPRQHRGHVLAGASCIAHAQTPRQGLGHKRRRWMRGRCLGRRVGRFKVVCVHDAEHPCG